MDSREKTGSRTFVEEKLRSVENGLNGPTSKNRGEFLGHTSGSQREWACCWQQPKVERSGESLGGKAQIHVIEKHPGGSFREKVSELLKSVRI